MRTATWEPSGSNTPVDRNELKSDTRFILNDGNVQLELSMFSAMYGALACMRQKSKCSVEIVGGDEVFRFNGSEIQDITPFALMLQNFEFYLLEEEKAGYNKALIRMEDAMAAGTFAAANAPQVAEQAKDAEISPANNHQAAARPPAPDEPAPRSGQPFQGRGSENSRPNRRR